jgi:hypothetical protein
MRGKRGTRGNTFPGLLLLGFAIEIGGASVCVEPTIRVAACTTIGFWPDRLPLAIAHQRTSESSPSRARIGTRAPRTPPSPLSLFLPARPTYSP